MHHVSFNINWIAIAVATVAFVILGGLWFTVFFRRVYEVSLGRENAPAQEFRPIFIVGPALCSLAITITTALLMRGLQIDNVGDALQLGAIVGLGYLVPTTITIAINPNFPRPFLYSLISGSYFLIASLLASVILVVTG